MISVNSILFGGGIFIGALGMALIWLASRKLIVQTWGRIKWRIKFRPAPKFTGPRYHLVETIVTEPVVEDDGLLLL